MGLSVSSEGGGGGGSKGGGAATDRPTTVRVVLPDGSLREFAAPVSVSDVLVNCEETHFLCNSDTLYFDSEIQAALWTELLLPGQLYFMLPVSMRGNVLSGLDMAALAVKASSALAQQPNSKRRTSTRRVRVAPESGQLNDNKDASKNARLNQRINEDTVMVSANRSSVAVTAGVKKARALGRKGPKAMRRQLSIIMEVVE